MNEDEARRALAEIARLPDADDMIATFVRRPDIVEAALLLDDWTPDVAGLRGILQTIRRGQKRLLGEGGGHLEVTIDGAIGPVVYTADLGVPDA